MSEILPTWSLVTAFAAASFILALTPGPGVLYIVTRSLTQGKRSGLASVAGVALGNIGNAMGASIGLASLFAVSSAAFTVVKYLGASYLIYLGIKALRATGQTKIQSESAPSAASWAIFRDGFIVSLLNPKTTVFFAAFLPQFMDAGTTPLLESLVLGTLFVAIAATTDTLYVFVAGAVAPALTRVEGLRVLGRYLPGGTFIGLGVLTALGGSRSSK